jgi:hypothetical protein
VVRLKVAYNTDAITEIYRDGRLEFSETGVPNFYNDVLGGYFKGGLYRFGDALMPDSKTLYHRGFVLGDETSSFLEVSGRPAKERAFSRSLV